MGQPNHTKICLFTCGIPVLEYGTEGNVTLLKFFSVYQSNFSLRTHHKDLSLNTLIVEFTRAIFFFKKKATLVTNSDFNQKQNSGELSSFSNIFVT